MRVLLFGTTGMVGQGVLRECLLDPQVDYVLSVARNLSGQKHEKLHEIVHQNFYDLSSIEEKLSMFDAGFFCLGISSAGMNEASYKKITYDLTLAVANTLAKQNPNMSFIYVSGAGTDSTEHGRIMWARVKGKTENALFQLPFKAAYMLRPGFIQPLYGIKSKTPLYRILYQVIGPVYPVLNFIAPRFVTTTELVGRAMLKIAKHGASKKLLENKDINALGSERNS